MPAADQSGNKLLEFIGIGEEDAAPRFSPVTVCLLVVKIGRDYLMGFNHWRKGREIVGGCTEKGEPPREAMVREEYGAVFGITPGEDYPERIGRLRTDREEIERIALLSRIPAGEEIRTLDRKLAEFC